MASTDLSIQSAEYSLRNPAVGPPGRLLCLDIYRALTAVKQETSDSLVEDDDSWPPFWRFLPGKVAPLQTYAHGVEVAGSDYIDQGIREIFGIDA